MRASRLMSILMLLQLRLRVTAEELAREFEVSVRSIYRDIDELSASGIPVYADRGPGGGFRLQDGYRTRLTGLAADEAEAMFMIGLPEAAADLGLGAAATRAGRKLMAALPPALSEDAGRMGSRFYLDTVEWYQAAVPAKHLPAVARAVFDQRALTMQYRSWTTTRNWRVEPLGLVLKAGAWYLVAASSKGIRTFKVAEILELTVEEARFERPANFELAAHWRAELRRFEETLRPAEISLRVSAAGRERLTRLGAYAVLAVAKAGEPDARGWIELRLPVENIEQAALLVLGLGPEADVLAPAALRKRVGELARAVARRAR